MYFYSKAHFIIFLGASAESRKAPVIFAMSFPLSPSVRVYQRG